MTPYIDPGDLKPGKLAPKLLNLTSKIQPPSTGTKWFKVFKDNIKLNCPEVNTHKRFECILFRTRNYRFSDTVRLRHCTRLLYMLHLPDMGCLCLHARMLPFLDGTFRTYITDKKEINNYSTIDLWLLPECSLWLKPNLGKIPCTIQVANQPWDHNCLITSCSEVRSQEWYASIPRWEKFPTLMLIWHLNDFIDYTIVEKMSKND